MTAREFFDKVVAMRDAQKMYFKTRHSEYMDKSKKLEREIDREIERVRKIRYDKMNPKLF